MGRLLAWVTVTQSSPGELWESTEHMSELSHPRSGELGDLSSNSWLRRLKTAPGSFNFLGTWVLPVESGVPSCREGPQASDGVLQQEAGSLQGLESAEHTQAGHWQRRAKEDLHVKYSPRVTAMVSGEAQFELNWPASKCVPLTSLLPGISRGGKERAHTQRVS